MDSVRANDDVDHGKHFLSLGNYLALQKALYDIMSSINPTATFSIPSAPMHYSVTQCNQDHYSVSMQLRATQTSNTI